MVILATLSFIAGFILNVIGEVKQNRKLRLIGLALYLPMILFGIVVYLLMSAFSNSF